MKKNDKPKKKQAVKLPYIFVRKALENESSIYQLNFFDKMKRLFTILDQKSGKAAKREALKARKKQDEISRLQLASSTFLKEKVFIKLNADNNPTKSKVIDVQLDPKFAQVKASIMSNADMNVDISERPINPNYRIFTDDIPVRFVVKRKSNDV